MSLKSAQYICCPEWITSVGSDQRWKVQEAAGAEGDGGAGAVDSDEGWRRFAGAPWAGPGPAERKVPVLKKQGADRASQPPPPQLWRDPPPGWVWQGTQPRPLPFLGLPHLKEVLQLGQQSPLSARTRTTENLPMFGTRCRRKQRLVLPDGGSPRDDEETLSGGRVDWGGRWPEDEGTCLAEEFPAPPKSDCAPITAPPRGSPPPSPSLSSSSASRLCSSCQSSSKGGKSNGD